MQWALLMMRLCAACRNTSVSRTTARAPEEMTSAKTWPGPTDGSWSMSPTIKRPAGSSKALRSACISRTSTIEVSVGDQQVAGERVIRAAFETIPLGVDLEQPVDRLGLEAGRLGHALGGAAGRRTEQEPHPLRGKD